MLELLNGLARKSVPANFPDMLLRFDEPAGTLAPKEAFDRYAVTTTLQPTFEANGRFGNCINFPAGSNCVIAYDPLFDLLTEDFTLEAWINLPNATTWNTAFNIFNRANINVGGGAYALWCINNAIEFYYCPQGTHAGAIRKTGSILTPLNTWIHVALVAHGAQLQLYQDGKLSMQMSRVPFFKTNYPLSFGSTDITGRFVALGKLDELSLTVGEAKYLSDFTPSTKPLGM